MKPVHPNPISRRRFLGGTAAVAAASSFAATPIFGAEAAPKALTSFSRKLKLGVVGNGTRGAWLAKLFKEHGGYDMWAVADYFPDVAQRCGAELGVDPSRCFSTLSGYKKLIESGVEAVAVETPPYFIPEQVEAAVAVGLHVYMAKPVAVDVPGVLRVQAAGQRATRQRTCFLVDYQIPTDPTYIEVARRIREGALGRITHVHTRGIGGGTSDPPKTATIEDRLQKLIWLADVALGCDFIGNFDIHAIDAVLWVLGQRPTVAMGASAIRRANPHGDARDVCSVIYEYADGVVHNHFGMSLRNSNSNELSAAIHGTEANAFIPYTGKAFVRGGKLHYTADAVTNLYQAGAQRNIARFHREIVEGPIENDTCRRAVDGALTCILGYEAAARHGQMTMAQLISENKRLEADLNGLRT